MNWRNIFLVAGRECRQVMTLKSFWLTLLLLPAMLALGPLLGDKLAATDAQTLTVIDRSGTGAGAALAEAIQSAEDQRVLGDLARYAQRYDLAGTDPQAPWARDQRWFGPQDVAAFRAAGGLPAARAKLSRAAPEGTPAFTAPRPEYRLAPPPPALARADAAALPAAAAQATEAEGPDRRDLVVVIPAAYPRDSSIGVWAADTPRRSFATLLDATFTADLRARRLTASGVAPAAAVAALNAQPAIAVVTPARGDGAGREAMLVRSAVPLALAYILALGLTLSGNWMLQGAVEERSKKLLESLLACIRPEELMMGKILGAVAIGLAMLMVWIGCGLLGAFLAQGAIADMIRPALAPLTSPLTIATMIGFFVAGYVAISILFIAVGALADSMSEATGYVMPLTLAVLVPVAFLMQAIIAGNTGPVVHLFTWVPIWTPFAMLARMGLGVPVWEIAVAAVLMVLFIAAEVVLVGRLFRASLLADGQKPGLRQILERMRAGPA